LLVLLEFPDGDDPMWKRDQSVTPPSASRDQSAKVAAANSSSTENVIVDLGTSVIIKGELSGSEDLTLYGQMEGSVTLSEHTLTIGPHADIKAGISAKAVVIMGAVTGNVTATERIDIRATGSVAGDIDSPRLAIADGGSLCGKVQMP
jgi:cytoskeletal protein CcmA (bactofilin family)